MNGLIAPLMALQCGFAAAGQYAPVTPMASQSLLLDITAAGERLVVVGERGHILYSDDIGGSWRQARVPTTQMLTAVDFVDTRRGWAVGHDGLILVSDDGGSSWQLQRDGLAAQRQANAALLAKAQQRLQRLTQAVNDGGPQQQRDLESLLLETELDLEDAELTLQEEVHTSPLMDVWFQDESHGWAVGAFGTLLSTDNGGKTWLQRSSAIANPDEYHLNAVIGDSGGRLFIVGEAGVMFRSLDGGNHWQALPSLYDGSWFGVVYNPLDESLLVFGLRGNLFRSLDFGDSWQRVANEHQVTLAGGSASKSGAVVLVGGVGTVMLSNDGGKNFTHDTVPDRLSLSSALLVGQELILVGQGGIKRFTGHAGSD